MTRLFAVLYRDGRAKEQGTNAVVRAVTPNLYRLEWF